VTLATTAASAAYLERVAAELDLPQGRYLEAARRYKSVGDCLGRDESALKDLSPEVDVQGSLRLGIPICPVNDGEHYDLDLVCGLHTSKSNDFQQELAHLLSNEIQLYARHCGMLLGCAASDSGRRSNAGPTRDPCLLARSGAFIVNTV